MGIAIAIFYLPLLGLITTIAIAVSQIPIRAARANATTPGQKSIAYIAGSILAVTITTAYAWWYSTRATNEWDPVIGSLTISLLGPPTIGLSMLAVWATFGKRKPSSLNYAISGALQSIIVMPFVGVLAFAFYDHVVHKPTFDRLCERAKTVVFENVQPARSIAFIPEAFLTSNRTGDARQDARRLLLAINTPLEFVEAHVLDWSGKDHLLRVTLAGKSNNSQSFPPHQRGPLAESPIDASVAEYRVVPSMAEIPESLSGRTYGQKIEIFRASDAKLIAYAEYFWDNNKWWECPTGISNNGFIAKFIAESLNIPNSY